jgi:hypothetical protein
MLESYLESWDNVWSVAAEENTKFGVRRRKQPTKEWSVKVHGVRYLVRPVRLPLVSESVSNVVVRGSILAGIVIIVVMLAMSADRDKYPYQRSERADIPIDRLRAACEFEDNMYTHAECAKYRPNVRPTKTRWSMGRRFSLIGPAIWIPVLIGFLLGTMVAGKVHNFFTHHMRVLAADLQQRVAAEHDKQDRQASEATRRKLCAERTNPGATEDACRSTN